MDDWKTYPFTHRWNGTNIEYRPYIDVEIVYGDKKRLYTDVLVDSGCETTLVNINIARRLGIDLKECTPSSVSGAGGAGIEGFGTSMKLNIVDFEHELVAPVIFTFIPASIVLGQRNFFEHYKIHFERDVMHENGTPGVFRLKRIESPLKF